MWKYYDCTYCSYNKRHIRLCLCQKYKTCWLSASTVLKKFVIVLLLLTWHLFIDACVDLVRIQIKYENKLLLLLTDYFLIITYQINI